MKETKFKPTKKATEYSNPTDDAIFTALGGE